MARSNWTIYKKSGAPSVYLPLTEVENHVEAHRVQMGATRASAAIVYDDDIIAYREFNGTSPMAKYRVASLAKIITGSAIQKLIDLGTITRNTLVANYLGFTNPPDSRISNITVGHCLDHKGGWDETDPQSYDPFFEMRLVADFSNGGLVNPPTFEDMVEWAMTRDLDYNPGTQTQYSNIGYVVLGRVIEVATNTDYEDYVNAMLATAKAATHHGFTMVQDAYEVPYLNAEGTDNSVYGADPGAVVERPYGVFAIESGRPTGGLVFNIRDFAVYLAATFPGGPIPQTASDANKYQAGLVWWQGNSGSMPGTFAQLSRRWNKDPDNSGTLKQAVAFFNRRLGNATDDDLFTELDADLQLMV